MHTQHYMMSVERHIIIVVTAKRVPGVVVVDVVVLCVFWWCRETKRSPNKKKLHITLFEINGVTSVDHCWWDPSIFMCIMNMLLVRSSSNNPLLTLSTLTLLTGLRLPHIHHYYHHRSSSATTIYLTALPIHGPARMNVPILIGLPHVHRQHL